MIEPLTVKESNNKTERFLAAAILLALLFLLLVRLRRWSLIFFLRNLPEIAAAVILSNSIPSEARRIPDLERELLQTQLEETVSRLAEEVSRAGTTAAVDQWEQEMREAVVDNILRQAVVSRRRELLPSEILELNRTSVVLQLEHIETFANALRSSIDGRDPKSRKYIRARSQLYSGVGRATWYRGDEEQSPVGVVIDYDAVDDHGTCEPCQDAQNSGPYLPGLGPFPGQVCRGRGRCRCIRVPRYSPIDYQRLIRFRNEGGFNDGETGAAVFQGVRRDSRTGSRTAFDGL